MMMQSQGLYMQREATEGLRKGSVVGLFTKKLTFADLRNIDWKGKSVEMGKKDAVTAIQMKWIMVLLL